MVARLTPYTKEEIKELLDERLDVLKRALVVLYERQDPDEQASHVTLKQNGRGFSAFDADILTSFAKQVIARDWLSDKQVALAKKKLARYAGQLTQVANDRIIAAQFEPTEVANG